MGPIQGYVLNHHRQHPTEIYYPKIIGPAFFFGCAAIALSYPKGNRKLPMLTFMNTYAACKIDRFINTFFEARDGAH